jgi:uncharacterized protein DUF4154
LSAQLRDSVRRPKDITSRCGPRRIAWRTPEAALIPILAAALFVTAPATASGNADVETRIKAAFIYNFARFVEWPARASPGPVRIAILGHGDLAAPLEEVIRGKTANGRSIEVTHISAATEMDCCEILVIERSEAKHVGEIVEALAGKPVLTVCDGGNCLRDGVMIVFQMVDESVRFQINQEAAEHAGLKISSQLLKVAIPAGGKRQ